MATKSSRTNKREGQPDTQLDRVQFARLYVPIFSVTIQTLKLFRKKASAMPRQWTDEQRTRQAERCRQHQPWKYSTGPKSVAGKRKVSQNPRKPASYEMSEALTNQAYRYLDATGDLDGYRALLHRAALIRRRWWRGLGKRRSDIKPWRPGGRPGIMGGEGVDVSH